MQNKTAGRAFAPILVIYLLVTVFLVFFPLQVLWNMNKTVMIAGNTILFIASAISFYLYKRSLSNNNVHAFLRMIYGGMFAKMVICLLSAIVYIMIAKKNVSKGAIFGLMFLYFVYTFVEISIIMRLSRKTRSEDAKIK